jgi:Ca-activated chloride channel family protein
LIHALAFLLLLQSDPTFKVDINMIRVEVQVTDRDKPVLGLNKEAFQLFDEGVAQPIVSLATEAQPLDLVLLIDLSGSMARVISQLRITAADSLRHLRPVDRISVVTFDTDTTMLLDLTADHQQAAVTIQSINSKPRGTEINAPIFDVAHYLQGHARQEARRAILILSDNLGGRLHSDEVVTNKLWESDVVLHAILFPHMVTHQFGRKHIEYFATATGGETFWGGPDKVDLTEAFDRIRQRYALYYQSADSRSTKTRRITVKLNSPQKYKVLHRTGYRPRLNKP